MRDLLEKTMLEATKDLVLPGDGEEDDIADSKNMRELYRVYVKTAFNNFAKLTDRGRLGIRYLRRQFSRKVGYGFITKHGTTQAMEIIENAGIEVKYGTLVWFYLENQLMLGLSVCCQRDRNSYNRHIGLWNAIRSAQPYDLTGSWTKESIQKVARELTLNRKLRKQLIEPLTAIAEYEQRQLVGEQEPDVIQLETPDQVANETESVEVSE